MFLLVELVQQFNQRLQGRNFVNLHNHFGASNFVKAFDIIQRVLFVAKKLTYHPYSTRVQKCKSKCFRLLSEFRWEQNDWDVALFQQTLEQFNPELSRLFFQIVTQIIHHPTFSKYIQESRTYFKDKRIEVLNPDRRSLILTIPIFRTLHVIDSFVQMATKLSQIG